MTALRDQVKTNRDAFTQVDDELGKALVEAAQESKSTNAPSVGSPGYNVV